MIDYDRQRRQSENTIRDAGADFYTKYYCTYHLQSLAVSNPEAIVPKTVEILGHLIRDRELGEQRKGYFLFRLAAETLTAVMEHSSESPTAKLAYTTLKEILRTEKGHAQTVAAEALGQLPISVRGPRMAPGPSDGFPAVTWKRILEGKKLILRGRPRFFGRSLVAELRRGENLIVLKMARKNENHESLLREAAWIRHIGKTCAHLSRRFDIPELLEIQGTPVIRLTGPLPAFSSPTPVFHPERYALCYVVHPDYFVYANAAGNHGGLTEASFREVMGRNAWLLARLAAMGIVHSAPIPLFHNRAQRNRRGDQGLYLWFRAGRLDRWLESSAFPNVGLSGPRDFEHLMSHRKGSRDLYRMIGTHFLGLFLVAGSYFRYRDESRMGLDDRGDPVDARDFFDRDLFSSVIRDVFLEYYTGFTGRDFKGEFPVDLDKLCDRMIEEMGVDRHMEEILRVADQNEMSDKGFRTFLAGQGFSKDEIKGLQKGRKDVVIRSGPHLGGFNEHISIPELIDAIAALSALCIAGRYWKEKSD